MTKTNFLSLYLQALLSAYTWTRDQGKLDAFMESVKETLDGPKSTWNHSGECVDKAWQAMGGKGKPTLKALRALNP